MRLCFSIAFGSFLAGCASSGVEGSPGTSTLPDAGPGPFPGGDAASDGANGPSTSDAGAPARAAILAPADTWSWVPIDGTACANGSKTGIGINPRAGATTLVVYLAGGGACYDGASCWTKPTAANISSGYDGAAFAKDPVTSAFIFSRATENPFADADFVYVPYCTGDLHGGTNIATYDVGGTPTPTRHVGAKNLDAILGRLVPTFPRLTRVILMGSSAGGYGALLNQDRFARAFGDATIDVVDDSGPAVSFQASGGPSGLSESWKLAYPPGCAPCATEKNAVEIFAYDRKTYPGTKFAFMTYAKDNVLPYFFGKSVDSFAPSIASFEDSFQSDPNAAYFSVSATGHVVLRPTADPSLNLAIVDWLAKFVRRDPNWATVRK